MGNKCGQKTVDKYSDMGYDIHITRKDHWTDDTNSGDISLDEWKDFVGKQPDLRLDNYAEAQLPDGDTLRVDSDGLVVWTKYSGDGKDGNHAWFDYSDGCIIVKNPDEEILKKMSLIADQLNAKVQGDDGELYINGQLQKTNADTVDKKAWWKFW